MGIVLNKEAYDTLELSALGSLIGSDYSARCRQAALQIGEENQIIADRADLSEEAKDIIAYGQ